jgi:hypothetical protein
MVLAPLSPRRDKHHLFVWHELQPGDVEGHASDMEVDSGEASTQARRASTSSLPPAPKEVKTASQLSGFAKRLLVKRSGPAEVRPARRTIQRQQWVFIV